MIKWTMCFLNNLFVIGLIILGPFILAFAFGWWLGKL